MSPPLPPDPWASKVPGQAQANQLSRPRRQLELPDFRRAAVLVALTREADPRILLTVRSSDLPTHKGQIAFPGGSLEAGETPVQAALREAQEEVGLDPASVKILGELDDVFTPIGFHVTPVLARIDPETLATLTLTTEVTRIITPTVAELRGLDILHEIRTLPSGEQVPMVRFPWQSADRQLYDIWGMTARILYELLVE